MYCDISGFGRGTVWRSCEDGDEPSVFVRGDKMSVCLQLVP